MEEEKDKIDLLYLMHFQEMEAIQCSKVDKKLMADEAELIVAKLDQLKREILAVNSLTLIKLVERHKEVENSKRKTYQGI